MGLQKTQEKEFAKILYLNGETQKAIAERVGVSEKTIGKWVEQEHWDEIKTSLLATSEQQLALLYNQLKHINEAISNREQKYADPKEADTIVKITKSIKQMETETGVGEAVQVCKKLVLFVQNIDFELSQKITKNADLYIQSLLQ